MQRRDVTAYVSMHLFVVSHQYISTIKPRIKVNPVISWEILRCQERIKQLARGIDVVTYREENLTLTVHTLRSTFCCASAS